MFVLTLVVFLTLLDPAAWSDHFYIEIITIYALLFSISAIVTAPFALIQTVRFSSVPLLFGPLGVVIAWTMFVQPEGIWPDNWIATTCICVGAIFGVVLVKLLLGWVCDTAFRFAWKTTFFILVPVFLLSYMHSNRGHRAYLYYEYGHEWPFTYVESRHDVLPGGTRFWTWIDRDKVEKALVEPKDEEPPRWWSYREFFPKTNWYSILSSPDPRPISVELDRGSGGSSHCAEVVEDAKVRRTVENLITEWWKEELGDFWLPPPKPNLSGKTLIRLFIGDCDQQPVAGHDKESRETTP